MQIHDKDNELILDVAVDDNSYRYKELMGDNTLSLMFSMAEFIELPVRCRCEFKGESYFLFSPENFKKNHTRSWDYTLVMHSHQKMLSTTKFKHFTLNGGVVEGRFRLKFSLTATPAEFAQLLVDNMNINDPDGGWTVGECIDASPQTLDFNHEYCDAALAKMATAFNTEYDATVKTISIGPVEKMKDSPIDLEYGYDKGVLGGIQRTQYDDSKIINRVYVQGGSDNIDASVYGNDTLLLPKSTQFSKDGVVYMSDPTGSYVERADRSGAILDDSLDVSDVKPRWTGAVSSVVVVNDSKSLYDIIDNSIPGELDFAPSVIEGETMSIIFQSGDLAGKEFDVAYDHDERRFAIVPVTENGYNFPQGALIPALGNTYAVFHISLPEYYYQVAELEAMTKTVDCLSKGEKPQYTYKWTLDELYAKRNWLVIGGKLDIGYFVLYRDPQFLTVPVSIRIISVKDYVSKPKSPVIEISNNVSARSFSSVLNTITTQEQVNDRTNKEVVSFTRRRFRDTKETMEMMAASLTNFTGSINPITVETMQAVFGDESLQLRFVNSKLTPQEIPDGIDYVDESKRLTIPSSIIQHMTIGITSISSSHSPSEYKFWDMEACISPVLDEPDTHYYLYAKVSKVDSSGEFLLSETAIAMEGVAGYYHLLLGILNSEYEGTRSFASMYGYTEILPGRITTNKIVSPDGNTFFDLVNGIIQGKFTFKAGSSGIENLDEWAGVQEDIDAKGKVFVVAPPTTVDGYVGGGSATPAKSHPSAEPQGEGVCFDELGEHLYSNSEYVDAAGSTPARFPLFKYSRLNATPVTKSFQDGVDGYTGTLDTYIWDTNPDIQHGAEATFIADNVDATEVGRRKGLLKFDLSSIPANAIIVGAKVDLNIAVEGQGWAMYKMLVPWSEESTYNSLGGVTPDGIKAAAAPDCVNGINLDTITGFVRNNVPAATIQGWVDGSAQNYGWLFDAIDAATGDGVQFSSREDTTPANRPNITIRYILPGVQENVSYWSDGISQGNFDSSTNWQELSGITAAYKAGNSNYLWVLSDSPANMIAAVSKSNASNQGVWTLSPAPTKNDWEDIESSIVNGVAYLYIFDFGNNPNAVNSRGAGIDMIIHRVVEPTITGSNGSTTNFISINCAFPAAGAPTLRDCEAAIIDPATGDIYIITKREAIPGVYKLPHQSTYTGIQTLTYMGKMYDIPDVTTLALGSTSCNVVDATINKDGTEIIVKNYNDLYLFTRNPNSQTIFEALQGAPSTPYNVGDLWFTSLLSGSGDIYKCLNQRLSDTFVQSDWVKASKYTDDTAAAQAQVSANAAAQDASNAQADATTANTEIANIANDNVLSPVEKSAERSRWNTIAAEKSGIDAQAVAYSITAEKTAYDAAFQALATYLNAGTAWSTGVIPIWIADIYLPTNTTIVGATYRDNWKSYYDSRTNLLNAIAAKAKTLADTAQTTANAKMRVFSAQPVPPYEVGDLWANANYGTDIVNELMRSNANVAANGTFDISDWERASKYTDDALAAEAVGKAEEAHGEALAAAQSAAAANQLLQDIASDSKLTPDEKQLTKKEWDVIVSELAKIDDQADAFVVSRTAYDNAYTSLSQYITPLLSSLTTTSDIVGSTFRTKFKTYYDTRTDLLNAISIEAKNLADAAQLTADDAAYAASNAQSTADALDYLKTAIGGDSTVAGGLALHNIMLVKNALGAITGGMSGLSEDNVGMWMKGSYAQAIADAAKAFKSVMDTGVLDKKDGSGHRAFGNFAWNTLGDVFMRGLVEVLSGGKIGDFTIESGQIIGRNGSGAEKIRMSTEMIPSITDLQSGILYTGSFPMDNKDVDISDEGSAIYSGSDFIDIQGEGVTIPYATTAQVTTGQYDASFTDPDAILSYEVLATAYVYKGGVLYWSGPCDTNFSIVAGYYTVKIRLTFNYQLQGPSTCIATYGMDDQSRGIQYTESVARSCFGANGFFSYWSSALYMYFSSTAGLTYRGALNFPGMLAAGSFAGNGTQDSTKRWGNKSSGNNATYTAVGQYRVFHAINHANFTVNITCLAAGAVGTVVARATTYVDIVIQRDGANYQSAFDIMLVGAN